MLSVVASKSDSIEVLQMQVVALDAQLSVCEQEYLREIDRAKKDKTQAEKYSQKTAKKSFWRGFNRGVVVAIVTTAILTLTIK